MWISYLSIYMMVCQSLVVIVVVDLAVPINRNSPSNGRILRIKPQVCADHDNVHGVCMFQWECRQKSGVMLATCLDRFLFGTCCKLPQPPPSIMMNIEDIAQSNVSDEIDFPSTTTTTTTTMAALIATTTLVASSAESGGGDDDEVTTVTSSSTTQDVEVIVHEFLGSVLANYVPDTMAHNASLQADDVALTTTYRPVTSSSTMSTTDSENEVIDYADDDDGSVTHTQPEMDVIVSSSSSSISSTGSDSAESSTEVSSNDVATATDPVVMNTDEEHTDLYYEDVGNGDDFAQTTPTMTSSDRETTMAATTNIMPTTNRKTSTTTTTIEAATTTTQRQYDYRKDGGPRFVHFLGSWYSLIRVLLAIPAVLGQWFLSGGGGSGSGAAKCAGALACELLDQSSASAHLAATIFIPNEAYCGVRPLIPEGRIVGGTPSRFGEWPWQVLIKEATWLGLFVKNKCGGVLLNQRYVVTAAHCQPGFLASLLVIFGETDLAVNNGKLQPLQRNVRRIVVHKKYNALTFDNDIALLELERSVAYDLHILPICLPPDDEDFTGRVAVVSGWGRLRYGGRLPHDLQYVQVPILTNRKCQQMFLLAGHMKALGSKFLCAGFQDGGKDSCEGDSGGPLVLQDADGRWILVGTVSHGIKCAYPNLPGVYIKITAYKSWIQKIINS